jgi:TP901 family phage tail tape measure protein
MRQLETASDKIQKGSQDMLDMGVKVTAMGAALGAAFAYPIKKAGDFEAVMVKVGALSGATASEFDGLSESALELGRTTKFSAVEVGEGMAFMAMAGFEATEVIGAMPSVLQLATAAQIELAQAADITSNIMTGYGIEVEGLTKVNDALVHTFTNANTNLVQLGEAMKVVGPVASAAGADFDEIVASVGLLGKAGIQASLAGTSLRRGITALINPAGKGAEALDKLGIEAVGVDGAFVGMAAVLKQFEEKLAAVDGQAARTAIVMQIFGQRAGPGMSALLSQGSDALKIFTENIKADAGVAAEVSDKMLKSMKGSFTILTSAITGLLISIGSPFLDALSALFRGFATFLNWITKLREALGPVGTIITGLVGVLAVLLLTVGSLSVVVGATGLVIAAVSKGFNSWQQAITLVNAGLVRLKALNLSSWLTTIRSKALLAGTAFKAMGALGAALAVYEIGKLVGAIMDYREQLNKMAAESEVFQELAAKYKQYADVQVKSIEELKALSQEQLDIYKEAVRNQFIYLDAEISALTLKKDLSKEETERLFKLKVQYAAVSGAVDELTEVLHGQGAEVKAQEKIQKDYTSSLIEGSAEYIAIKQKELETLKAVMDYELAVEKENYNAGKISLKEYLDSRTEALETYTDGVIALKEMEIEALKKDLGTENIQKIKAIEEEIKQIRIESATEQLAIQADLQAGILKENEKGLTDWQEIQNKKLAAIKAAGELQNEIEIAAVEAGVLKQSELLENQLDRYVEYQQERIRIMTESLVKIAAAEKDGINSDAYQKAAVERDALQNELEVSIIASESAIREARENEETAAQKFIAEITDDRLLLVEQEGEEKLKILEKYLDQELITREQYADAVKIVEEDITDAVDKENKKRNAHLKGHVIASAETMKAAQDALAEALGRDMDDLYEKMIRMGDMFREFYFPSLRSAIRESVREIKEVAGELPDYLKELGNEIGAAVSYAVFNYAQQVAEYLSWIKTAISALQDTIMSYQEQLLQLQGDEIALVELWYQNELARLKQEFAGLEGSTEYKEAMKLLEELYKAKMEAAEEAMAQEEELIEESANTAKGAASGLAGVITAASGPLAEFASLAQGLTASGFISGGELKLTKEVKVDSVFRVESYDPDSTSRWLRDTVFPEFEKFMELKGA